MKSFKDHIGQKNKFNNLIEFCEKRKTGAKKIADQALAKGGLSLLTYYHFKAKLPIYDEIIANLKNGTMPKFENKINHLLSQLHAKLPQKKFQELAGEAEVWGETLAKYNN